MQAVMTKELTRVRRGGFERRRRFEVPEGNGNSQTETVCLRDRMQATASSLAPPPPPPPEPVRVKSGRETPRLPKPKRSPVMKKIASATARTAKRVFERAPDIFE